ncbi:MAG TPA: NAD(P)-dependent oxidoreductase [Candidatus Acidoferrales bacterium]|jgi:nucleoside-diphosphate-sugar epimerase|nr:NAD(P)-dependent oxidoreductase [Candidatus Acidoferrales bacterium]
MSSVLVTGASGFLGRQCLPILVAKGYDVHALSRRRIEAPLPGVAWHELDLLAAGAPREIMNRVQPERLLHLAWYAAPGKYWEARENMEWVRASIELLSAFIENNGKRVVAAGSCAEYALNPGECFEEKTLLLPTTLYGTCKHAFGSILESVSRQEKLSAAWGRIFFLYGPHEHASRLVAHVVQSLLHGEPALCSDGKQVLDFLHVEDAASAFVALLENEIQGPVNVASGRPIMVRDLLQEVGKQTERAELIRLGARESSSQVSNIWANVGKLTSETKWKPRYDLASGIQQTIEWWRNSEGLREIEPAGEARQPS